MRLAKPVAERSSVSRARPTAPTPRIGTVLAFLASLLASEKPPRRRQCLVARARSARAAAPHRPSNATNSRPDCSTFSGIAANRTKEGPAGSPPRRTPEGAGCHCLAGRRVSWWRRTIAGRRVLGLNGAAEKHDDRNCAAQRQGKANHLQLRKRSQGRDDASHRTIGEAIAVTRSSWPRRLAIATFTVRR